MLKNFKTTPIFGYFIEKKKQKWVLLTILGHPVNKDKIVLNVSVIKKLVSIMKEPIYT